MLSRWTCSRLSLLRQASRRNTLIGCPNYYQCYHASLSKCADIIPLRKELKDAVKSAKAKPTVPTLHGESVASRVSDWELTVGIEIHAQLNTNRKLFSRARQSSDDDPNVRLAPFDVALPGSQPSFEHAALIPALRAAIALNCHIESESRFDRKHYFYHDQPSGYQITQYYKPFARNGSVLLTSDDGLRTDDGTELLVGIKQIQMEQDTAKTHEAEDGTNLIDFSRSGQPLIEIISLPHIHSPQAAAAYIRKIQAILFSVDSVTTGMELGGLRADVNVSVRRLKGPAGSHTYSGVTGLGQRTEIKNLSSFKAVEDAVKAERDRQISILEAGGIIEGETRGWSISRPSETRRLRGKEGEVDYRYMPDPDIPPLRISTDLVAHLRATMPPTPEQLFNLLLRSYDLSPEDAKALLTMDDGLRFIYLQEVLDLIPNLSIKEKPKINRLCANWVLHELGALLATSDMRWTPDLVPAVSLARLIDLYNNSKITGASAKRLLKIIFEGDSSSVDRIVARENLLFSALSDEELTNLATIIIDDNRQVAESIKNGNPRKIGFLVGLMMKTENRNRIDARRAEAKFRSLLIGQMVP